jgi:hypothetical protein
MTQREIGANFTLCAALIIFSVIFTIYVSAPFGSLISADSVYYLSAGKSFSIGNGFTAFNNQPITLWPPLFPFLIAIIEFIGLDPITITPTMHGLFLGATAALTFLTAYGNSRSWILSALCGLLVATAMPLIVLANRLLADPIYIFLVSAVIYAVFSYRKRSDYLHLTWLGIFCALAALQRYAGASLIITVGLCLLLHDNRSLGDKLKRLIVFGLISCLPLTIWLFRNIFMTGSLSGSRSFSVDLFVPAITSATNTVGWWFAPMVLGEPFAKSVGIAIILSAVLVVLLSVWLREKIVVEISIFAIFVIVGFLFAVYALFTACCADRFLAPLFPVVVMYLAGLSVMVGRRLARVSSKSSRFITTTAIIIFCCVIGLQISRTSVYLENLPANGHSFNLPVWRNKAIVQHMVKYPFEEDACIFSNSAPAVAYFLKRYCVKRGPRKARYYPAAVKLDEREKIFATINSIDAKVYFIWFKGVSETRFFAVSALKDQFMIIPVLDTHDGTIYEISKKYPGN